MFNQFNSKKKEKENKKLLRSTVVLLNLFDLLEFLSILTWK